VALRALSKAGRPKLWFWEVQSQEGELRGRVVEPRTLMAEVQHARLMCEIPMPRPEKRTLDPYCECHVCATLEPALAANGVELSACFFTQVGGYSPDARINVRRRSAHPPPTPLSPPAAVPALTFKDNFPALQDRPCG